MTYCITKIVVTTALIVLISEISRRSTLVGAVLVSVPIVSVLAMIWLYTDTRDAAQIIALSRSIFWLVLPSLVLFLLLPALLERGHGFALSLAASIAPTIAAYFVTITVARYVGARL